jgi:hypothetical protein
MQTAPSDNPGSVVDPQRHILVEDAAWSEVERGPRTVLEVNLQTRSDAKVTGVLEGHIGPAQHALPANLRPHDEAVPAVEEVVDPRCRGLRGRHCGL